MGCHTWCYAHIPSEADKWAQDYKNVFKRNVEGLSRLSNISDEQQKRMAELIESIETLSVEVIPRFLDEKQFGELNYSLLFTCPSIDDDFGLFNVYNGKIYREVDTYRGKDPEIKKNWPFKHAYHDIFRIYTYDAMPCFSLDETLKRCEEFNVNWDLHSDYGYLINNKKKVYDFWKEFPNGMIEFE